MKKINYTSLLLLCLCSISTFAQKTSYDINTLYPEYMQTDTFDIQFYNEHKNNRFGAPSYSFFLEDSTRMEMRGGSKNDTQYRLITTKKNSSFSIKKTYYLSGELFAVSAFFFGDEYGKSFFYDKKGNVMRIIDWTETFKLKVEDLIPLIKEEYGIDLSIAYKDLDVDVCQSDKPFYRISIPIEEARFKRLIIDAATGKLRRESDIDLKLVDPMDPNSDNYWQWTPKLELKEILE